MLLLVVAQMLIGNGKSSKMRKFIAVSLIHKHPWRNTGLWFKHAFKRKHDNCKIHSGILESRRLVMLNDEHTFVMLCRTHAHIYQGQFADRYSLPGP